MVPREESEWFIRNSMPRYGGDMRDVNDSRNMIRLRADIHRCFDARMFTITPKPKTSSVNQDTLCSARDMAYVSHVFSSNVGEFSDMYHNVLLQYLNNTSREFLFARFAWTVLILVKPFVLAGVNRSIAVTTSQAGVEWATDELPGPKLSALYGGGGSPSASPKKRSRQREDDRGSLAGSDEWYQEIFEEEDRGRKRTRRGPPSLDEADRARTPALSNISTLISTRSSSPDPQSQPIEY